ncbi:hypothetical protein [sulfur-oxidizing endosymbiont of Gigantopelta aegis]|uniref:hypothetical protein n=1 Tax=sulfur-oxidizing endosymbiont of Gigantopelta aegis TaxID=2794934 RepID=UPI0018DB5D2F|nr:hypothetical protein [sulfur-oxidizing endosymbiont of Gigantopelta aegis]
MEEFLNKKNARLIIGIFVAAPFTATALLFGLYGIMFGIAGITSKHPFASLFGLLTALGLIGVAGAWRRLLKPTNKYNSKEQNKIRTMLFCVVTHVHNKLQLAQTMIFNS